MFKNLNERIKYLLDESLYIKNSYFLGILCEEDIINYLLTGIKIEDKNSLYRRFKDIQVEDKNQTIDKRNELISLYNLILKSKIYLNNKESSKDEKNCIDLTLHELMHMIKNEEETMIKILKKD